MFRTGLSLAAAISFLACGSSNAFHLNLDFTGADGSPWPAPWQSIGGVASSTVSGGFGRMVPVSSSSPYSLGRMGVSGSQRDVDVSFQFKFEDEPSQGIGFYVRQNGGRLQQTTPHGAGYAVFISSSFGGIGLWREEDGVEVQFASNGMALSSGVAYGARFRVAQSGASSTHLQARVWPASQPEPSTWQVDSLDSASSLQKTTGGFAVDSWSSQSSGSIASGTLVGSVHIDGL